MSNARAALIEFDAPVALGDGQGGRIEGWQPQFRRRAHVRYLRGTEAVIGARLTGVQPVVIRIRRDEPGQAITPKWRIRFPLRAAYDADGNWLGDVINIKAIVPADDYRFLEITATIGEPS